MFNRQSMLIFFACCICLSFLLLFVFIPILRHLYTPSVALNTASFQPPVRIMLIPLDSRPPCRDYAGQLSSIANIQTITPPAGYLDNYNNKADIDALANWFLSVGPSVDAVVISTDTLIHGGLLASRLSIGDRSDAERTLQLIEKFHQKNPRIPIYVFNIIPRLYIAETPENQPYKFIMAEFSILTDKLAQNYNDTDRIHLEELRNTIPAPILQRYENMYAVNAWLGQRLLEMAEQGILQYVVLGQDDAQPYGMANMVSRSLQSWLAQHPHVKNATITRGTDEVGLTLVARLITEKRPPRVFVQYSSANAPNEIMPYMPSSVDQTVREKIALVNGEQVLSPHDADFILYVHIGTPETPAAVLIHAAQEIRNYQQNGHLVAVVDLSKKYDPDKNIFPYMEKARVDLVKLAAYAGWNTTSNSVGTAIAQAAIYNYARQHQVIVEEQQYAFLFQRYLDDWYFQKEVQPELSQILPNMGISSTKLDKDYAHTDLYVQKKLSQSASFLYLRHFARKSAGSRFIVDYDLFIQLPWSRIFEVQANTFLKTVDKQQHTIFSK